MSKIWFPWQRAIRTALAVIVGVVITTAGGIAAAAVLAPQVLEAIRDLLDPEVYTLLAGWVATLTVVALFVSRIMAIPAVDAFLHKFGAGSSPVGAVTYTPQGGIPLGLTRRQYRALTEGSDTGEKERMEAADTHDTRD